MVYMYNDILYKIIPNYIEPLCDMPDLVILLSDIPYTGRYITLKEALELRRIEYSTKMIDTFDKAIAICNLYNRVGMLSGYIYSEYKPEIDVSKMWIESKCPSFESNESKNLESEEIQHLVEIFNTLKDSFKNGRLYLEDMDFIKLIYSNATLADLAELYRLL